MGSLNELALEIIQRCPNSCIHCSSLSSPSACIQISASRVSDVAKQSRALGLKCISISGGEPLLHPELADIISGILSQGISIRFYTTGIEFNKFGEAVCRNDWSLFPHNSVCLIFSLHSYNPVTHDFISGRKGAFKQTKTAILSALRQGYSVETHIVPNKLNLSELEETLNIVASWGVERVSFLRLVLQGNALHHVNQLRLDEKGSNILHALGRKLEDEPEKKHQIRFGVPFSGYISHQRKCTAGKSKLLIRYDGKILPCEAFKDKNFEKFVLGDIRNTSLLEALAKGTSHHPLSEAKKMVIERGGESCPAQFLLSQQSGSPYR